MKQRQQQEEDNGCKLKGYPCLHQLVAMLPIEFATTRKTANANDEHHDDGQNGERDQKIECN